MVSKTELEALRQTYPDLPWPAWGDSDAQQASLKVPFEADSISARLKAAPRKKAEIPRTPAAPNGRAGTDRSER